MKERYVKKIIKKSEIETVKVNTNAKRTIHNLKKKKQDKINFQIQNQIRTQKGITLLALVITIIVLLILAGITINAITGDNGIIGNAGRAKEEAEIANEKDILEKATVQAMGNNKYGNIEEEELQEQLDKETGERKTEATDVGEEFEVLFKESNRYYAIDKDGNVGEANIYEEDKYPGDITVGKDGEKLDGNTEETAYQIWCIEDLVKFSQMVNEENQDFLNKYVVLKTNLNFNSNFSYMNPDTTEFDNYLSGDGSVTLKEQLSEDGNGFFPIGRNYSTQTFRGSFDGENHIIRNIYIDQSSNAGLFGVSGGGTIYSTNRTKICNLTVEGNIIIGETNSQRAGGIVAYAAYGLVIENCHSQVNISGNVYGMGGIVGICQYGDLEIINCSNQGAIDNARNATGGIIGATQANINIVNTYNSANLKGTQVIGGMVGIMDAKVNIYNSYQVGDITGSSSVGGMIGRVSATATLRNVYTIGNINCSSSKGGIIGQIQDSSIIDCDYVYYKKADGLVGIYNENDSDFQINGYTEEEWNSTQMVTLLNEGRQKQEENINKQEWKTWKLGEIGYPVFE